MVDTISPEDPTQHIPVQVEKRENVRDYLEYFYVYFKDNEEFRNSYRKVIEKNVTKLNAYYNELKNSLVIYEKDFLPFLFAPDRCRLCPLFLRRPARCLHRAAAVRHPGLCKAGRLHPCP